MAAAMDTFKAGLRSLLPESRTDSFPSGSNGSYIASDQAQVIVRRTSGRIVSLWTCSKLCAVSFVLGIVVGFTLKRRLRNWANKLLKRLKDD